MNNHMTEPKILRQSKNKIKIDFERTSAWERFRVKYLSTYFLTRTVWVLFKFVLLLGISYIILFPFFVKIAASFMSPDDLVDVTVRMIPKYPTLNTYKFIILENGYYDAFINTFLLSFLCAVIQTLICSVVGYGFSKFKFRGNKILFLGVIFTMIVPHQTLMLSMFMKFRYFDIFGIYGLLNKLLRFSEYSSVNMINTFVPLIIMSLGGIAFKNGLYIFLMRQFFKGVPDELEEAAYIDGSGVFKTFVKIIVPTAIPMMITIFLFSFSWQWTDNFYTNLFFTSQGPTLMPNIVRVPESLSMMNFAAATLYQSGIRNTCGLLILLPLLLIYSFMQRYLIQGIERSGIVG